MTELGDGRRQRLDDMAAALDGLSFAESAPLDELLTLFGVMEKINDFPSPEGNPQSVESKAADYVRAGSSVDLIHDAIKSVAKSGLPSVWVGEAGAKAAEVTEAASRSAEHMSERLLTAGRELSLLAAGIGEAQRQDRFGRDALGVARSIIEDESQLFGLMPADQAERARRAARDALRYIRAGVDQAEAAGERAARELDKLKSEARAGQLDSEHLTDADRIVLSDAAAAGGERDQNEILTTGDLQRAGVFLDELSARDRQTYDGLLDRAKSPEERAYLMKALAAGYGVSEIQEFSDMVHPYGDDPAWLQEHLSPVINGQGDTRTDGGENDVLFGTEEWVQEGPTCVVSSTITARAMVDPLYALELTTGGRPGDPDFDNPEAFIERLHEEQAEMHREGGSGPDEGMSVENAGKAAEREISPHTGQEYELVRFADPGDRDSALPEIRDAVNAGQPVPFGVKSEDGAHQMMIIGQEGGQLQIYNPWGYTTWVSEEDFVNGEIPGATRGRLPEPYYAHIPD